MGATQAVRFLSPGHPVVLITNNCRELTRYLQMMMNRGAIPLIDCKKVAVVEDGKASYGVKISLKEKIND